MRKTTLLQVPVRSLLRRGILPAAAVGVIALLPMVLAEIGFRTASRKRTQ